MRRAILLLLPVLLEAQKFFPDDPLECEPPPLPVEKAASRKVGEYYDFFRATFTEPGERNAPGKSIPAQGLNTLGEVMDGEWYVNRHYRKRLSIPDLLRGAGNAHPPSRKGPWEVIAAKTEGVTPGFTIRDAEGRVYMIKFDPARNPELATGAEAVCSRFLYALGYHVPEIYIVYFQPEDLRVAPGTTVRERRRDRPMKKRDVDQVLFGVPRDPHKGYRAIACRYLSGDILGEFHYEGTRSDDPNDIVPHEHRRELRGLFVFAAWLGHNDVKCLQTCDTLVQENGIRRIRHYLIDFGASLGSDSFTTKSPRAGYERLFRWRPAAAQLFSLGLYVPHWAQADYPHFASTGNFEYEVFEPEKWQPNYPATTFDNRLPDDTFWAARQVMAFTDEEIRAIVGTGEYSDPKAVEWLVKCLVERRNKIGRAYLTKVLPLDRFRVEDGRLVFDDLGVKYGLVKSPAYAVRWSRFDNWKQSHTLIREATDFALPAAVAKAAVGAYFAARITEGEKSASVYLRKAASGTEVVGIERTW